MDGRWTQLAMSPLLVTRVFFLYIYIYISCKGPLFHGLVFSLLLLVTTAPQSAQACCILRCYNQQLCAIETLAMLYNVMDLKK